MRELRRKGKNRKEKEKKGIKKKIEGGGTAGNYV